MEDDGKKPLTLQDLYWFIVLTLIFLMLCFFCIRILGIRGKGFLGIVLLMMFPIVKYDRFIRKNLGWENTYKNKEVAPQYEKRSLRASKYGAAWAVFMVAWTCSFNFFFKQMNTESGEKLFLFHMIVFATFPFLLLIIFIVTRPIKKG